MLYERSYSQVTATNLEILATTLMATRTTTRYNRHRQQAAVRRRRIVLLLVLAVVLCVVGVALAYPQLKTTEATPAMVGAKPTKAAVTPAKPAKAQATVDDAAAAASNTTTTPAVTPAATDGANGLPPMPATEWPDYKPTPQAQAAIDLALSHGRPPQFLISSFDGAADIDMYRLWLPLAQKLGARFTFFVSGIYMLLPQYGTTYKPPHKAAGYSALGGYSELAGSKGAVQNLRDNWAAFNVARMMGNEIGTHYVSHICEDSNTWTTADWVSEASQWESLMLNASSINHLATPITPLVTKSDFHGGRTPCLNGDKTALYAASKQMGWEYDASQEGILGQWPQRQQGIWNFPLPSIHRFGSKYATLAMDYNFYFNHGKVTDPGMQKTLENWTYQSYIGALNQMYHSNRAPLILGSHFATWNGGAYNHALIRTLNKACTTPEVACVDFITLARWLDQQSPAQLAKWNAGSFKQS